MSHQKIRDLLRVRLNAIASPLDTAWENVPFTPGSAAWQRVDMLWAPTENPTMGDNFRRANGIMQVSLFYPPNAGPDPAANKADALVAWFPRGWSVVDGSVRVKIDRTPFIGPAMQSGSWYLLPVSVPFLADIQPP
jgi:hypothetical protein